MAGGYRADKEMVQRRVGERVGVVQAGGSWASAGAVRGGSLDSSGGVVGPIDQIWRGWTVGDGAQRTASQEQEECGCRRLTGRSTDNGCDESHRQVIRGGFQAPDCRWTLGRQI